MPQPPHGRRDVRDRGRRGNGTIRRIWIMISNTEPEFLRGLVLRMYWDGANAGQFAGAGASR
jgi:hypothetical protein